MAHKKKPSPRADTGQLLAETNALQKQYDLSLDQLEDFRNRILKGNIQSFGELYKQIADTAKRINIFNESSIDSLTDISTEYAKILKLDQKTLDKKRDLVAALQTQLELKKQSGHYDDAAIDHAEKLLKQAKEHLKLSDDLIKRNKQFGGHLQTILGHTQKIADASKAFLPPYMGKLVDNVAASMERALIAGSGLSLVSAGFAAALLGAFVVLNNLRKQSQEIAKNTGLSLEQAHHLVISSYELQSSNENYLSTQHEIVETQQALMREFKNFHKVTESTVIGISNLSDSFGYTAESAARVQRIFEQIGGMPADMAVDLQAAVGSLAEAAGVAPGDVIKDIAENAGIASKFFAGQPKLLARTAVELHKIGLGLKEAATLAEGLLNIESSMTAQYTASAMIGRQMNLDTARRMVLNNDILGATKEILAQVGSISEFEQMNVLQKNAIAAASGLTTDQLMQSLWLQEATKDASAEELALINKYGSELGNINGLAKEEIIHRAEHVQITEKLAASLDKIATSIMPTIISLAEMLTPIFQAISWAVNQMVAGFDLIRPLLIPILAIITAIKAQVIMTAIAEGILTAYKSFSTMGPLGWALGTAAALATVGVVRNAVTADDMVMQPVTPGYSRVLSGPEGSIALNDKDSIVAGTNLNSAPNASSNEPGDTYNSYESDNGKIEKLLIETNKLLRQVVNRPIIISKEAVGAIGDSIKVNSSYG